MTYEKAIEGLKKGKCYLRTAWNGKNMFITRQIPAHITGDIIPKMQSLPQSAKDILMKTIKEINYKNQMLIINLKTKTADSWVASVSDTFEEDWIEVTEYQINKWNENLHLNN